MADVATKTKSMSNNSVVSSNLGKSVTTSTTKTSDAVCGVQSNNPLDRRPSSERNGVGGGNNRLTTNLCCADEDENDEERDLVLANNARNELDSASQDDKSLQELIESELALRICANNSGGAQEPDDVSDDEVSEAANQPEITKKIILEPRRVEPPVDINSEFIVNEIDHYTLIGEPYANGHASPSSQDEEDVQTTTTSGPSANEVTVDLAQQQQQQEEAESAGNTLSDPCVAEDNTDDMTEDSSKELSNQSVISTERYLEEELNRPRGDDSANLNSTTEGELQRSETDTREELPEDMEEDDDSSRINEAVEMSEIDDDEKLPQEQSSEHSATTLSSSTFIEHELQDAQINSTQEPFDEQQNISLKEASGIDEKACSFYSTDGEIVLDNDDGGAVITVDVTDYKLKSDLNSWVSVEDACAKSPSSVDIVVGQMDDSISAQERSSDNFYSQEGRFENYLEKSRLEADDDEEEEAPLATPDEISDISNANDDSESREEVITTSSVVSSSTTTTKKKKKIEGGGGGTGGSDASANHTKTKKTKKSKKSELEKENISVKKKVKSKEAKENGMHTGGTRQASAEMIEISAEDDLSNVNVKSLTQTYVSETNRAESESKQGNKEIIATGVSIKQLCRSFGDVSNMNEGERTTSTTALNSTAAPAENNRFQEKSSFSKFDALTKKSGAVLHVRSVDAAKVQQQLNSVSQNGDANPNCRTCGKVVFQMEQTKAEGLVWHKNCFRCVQCSKPLNVDNYESHEATLYCKPHFKELFQPKPVEESDQPTSDKPDLGLEELSALNVKSRFQVFEKSNEQANDIERSPSQVAVKRSPSILSKLAKFQAKGMDIGVTDESLNGIPFEESSDSEEEEEEEETEEVETESTIVKSKRGNREQPISFTKMDDMKNRWETTSQQGRREVQREARKEEIAGIRSKLFMGKQGKMKELYQQAVADSERITKINAAEEIQHATNARSIKERFERGEPIAPTSDDEQENGHKIKGEKPDEEVLAAGISRKSRSLFLEMDATAAKTGRPSTPNSQSKATTEAPRRARDMDSPDREIYRDPDVVRAEDRAEEVVKTDTARKMLSIFRQMEEKATKEELPEGPKPLKRFTPPPEDKYVRASASETDENEEEGEDSEDEEHNPNYVRASDKVEDEFLKSAKNAVRAKTLRAKFEHWEEDSDGKTSNHHHVEMDIAQTDGSQPSIESASALRARFESLGSQPAELPRAAKIKVNRFVEIQSNCMDVCESCEKKVYPLEKVETNNKIFHKQCFRCLQCNCILRMDTFTLNNGKLYCIPHFKQLFITRGNYDEGFGVDPHKNKWSTTPQAASAPIAVQNGGDV